MTGAIHDSPSSLGSRRRENERRKKTHIPRRLHHTSSCLGVLDAWGATLPRFPSIRPHFPYACPTGPLRAARHRGVLRVGGLLLPVGRSVRWRAGPPEGPRGRVANGGMKFSGRLAGGPLTSFGDSCILDSGSGARSTRHRALPLFHTLILGSSVRLRFATTLPQRVSSSCAAARSDDLGRPGLLRRRRPR